MRAIEIARQFAGFGETEEACSAYSLAIHEGGGEDPAEDMEAALYILQSGGDYKISYTCFQRLYNRGCFQDDCLDIMTQAFYAPNVKALQSRYERNCRLLSKYPYLFRGDFPRFDDLPVKFFPFDDKGYTPLDTRTGRFGDYVNFNWPVVGRNFFRDLDQPILARDVFSQYELEYLNDNVRKSEYVGRENHIYLRYSDWGEFCSYLQCLNMRPLLGDGKFVFLVGGEGERYPIDFKERYGVDYSRHSVKPLSVREVNRLIWHTQLASHNGGDFFNEVFDSHPNLLALPSVMFFETEEELQKVEDALSSAGSLKQAVQNVGGMTPRVVEELYHMRDRTSKDILVGMFLCRKSTTSYLDTASRIAPALFFQPHFSNVVYDLNVNQKGETTLSSEQYEKVRTSPIFQNFKYIKTFTPMRRPTTSHGATVKFMYKSALEANARDKDKDEKTVVSDAISERVLNRSFMIDWQDRLYKDSVLVRFEDGKLNPKATFTALCAFLDLPYTESMTYCSLEGVRDASSMEGNVLGFDPAAIYRTYDEYINDSERYYIEFLLRDAYEFYGYGFQYYDGAPMDPSRAKELTDGFDTMNHYIRETWKQVYDNAKVTRNGQQADEEFSAQARAKMLEDHMVRVAENRQKNTAILLQSLRFLNRHGQPLHMMPKLELDPALLEQPLYR